MFNSEGAAFFDITVSFRITRSSEYPRFAVISTFSLLNVLLSLMTKHWSGAGGGSCSSSRSKNSRST
jgi:hypothetical protein